MTLLCLLSNTAFVVHFFFFHNWVRKQMSGTLMITAWAARFWSVNSLQTERLQPETYSSCCRRPAPRSSVFPGTFKAEDGGNAWISPGPSSLLACLGSQSSPWGWGGGGWRQPQPSVCFNKHFSLPMRKHAAAQRSGRVGFPSYCLPGSARTASEQSSALTVSSSGFFFLLES